MEQTTRSWLKERIYRITSGIGKNCYTIASIDDYLNPVEFAQTLDLSKDISASLDKVDMSLTPYLVAPLMQWDFDNVKEVSIVAPEQTGKSSTWVWGLIWSFIYKPCLSLVCYPSDDHAAEANHEKLIPLMRGIERLNLELNRPKAKTKDHFHFSNIISYFMGSGSRVTSKSAMIRVADEIDDWINYDGKVDNLKDLRKRARTFNQSLLYKVCSPTKESGAIWQEFLNSSQGYWHLRCQGCGELTLRSCDIHNLQFKLNENEKIIGESIRLICQKCKHEHDENDKRKMNIDGDYIHIYPELIKTLPGYQWGALASQLQSLSWLNIATAQLKAGRSGDLKDQYYFDNSIRGLPFKLRKAPSKRIEHLSSKKVPIKDVECLYKLISVDTQDNGWYWVIRGVDENKNTCLLSNGKIKKIDELDDIFKTNGCYAGIIDSGGHRMKEVEEFVKNHDKFFMYKGNSRIGVRKKISNENRKLILANPYIYQSDLLYYMYSAEKKDNNYWYINNDVDTEYIEQMAALKPDNKKKNGNEYENWFSEGNDHYFDCEKMWLVLNEYAESIFFTEKKQNIQKSENIKTNPFATSW